MRPDDGEFSPGNVIGILGVVISIVRALLPYLFPPEKYGPVVRRWIVPALELLVVVVFAALALFVKAYWGWGLAGIVLVACVARWKPLLTRLRGASHTLGVWWYNWQTRRRLPRIIGEVLTRGYCPLLKEVDPRRHDAHERGRPIPYESFFYRPARLRHDVPPGQHGNRLDRMRPTMDGGLAVLDGSAVEGDGNRACRIYGPYVTLARSGAYLVTFRMRCRDQVGGQVVEGCEVEANVTHDSDRNRSYLGHSPVRVSLRPGNYAPLPLLFVYGGEPAVEFTLHAEGEPAAAVVFDVVCVLRIGDGRA